MRKGKLIHDSVVPLLLICLEIMQVFMIALSIIMVLASSPVSKLGF